MKNNLSSKIKTNLGIIFKSKLLYVGILIRIVSLIVTLSLNKDLNDMNEVLILAIQRLFNGQNPYENGYEYLLSVCEDECVVYNYHLGYPPVLLIIYSIVMIYPEMWGVWQLNIVIFALNVIFDFLCVYLLFDKDKRLGNCIMGVYWSIPFFSYADYVTFYSLIYLLVFLTIYYIDQPLKSAFFMFLCIGSYHLMLLMLPAFIAYYFRSYTDREESVEIYKKRYDAHNNQKFTIKENFLASIKINSLKNAFNRMMRDLKSNGWTIMKKICLGLLPTALIILPFILWDPAGFKYHLLDANADRYDLSNIKGYVFAIVGILIFWIIFSFIITLLIEKQYIAKIWVVSAVFITFIILSWYLLVSTDYEYPHYFGLILP
ncbi:MAG: hypothetical protein GF364_01345, partial [Candidatus Lokiarchaeota archaeon]|nr:hypothetical protein [Candidatus Lokiarchaeota archaeon]